MAIKCIYFEKVAPDFKLLIEQERPDEINLIYWPDLKEEEQLKALAEADAFITAIYPITRQLMEKAPRLKIVQKMGVGVDNIDVKSATEMGVAVGNAPGGNANGVAELTIGLILGVYRKLCILNRSIKNGEWLMFAYRTSSYELKGKTHGIIGFGHIGQEVARLSRAFGTSILYYAPHQASSKIETELQARYTNLDELLRQSDIVSVHVPLLPQTKNLIDAGKLSLMKPNAIIINVSRGSVVNERDLYEALVSKRLLGAGVDVWSQEPPSPDNPLLQLDCVLATPHVGGGTVDTSRNIFRMSFANICACVADRSCHLVNRPVR